VGKSVTALLLMQLLYARGYSPFYLKPFQTGCIDPYDADSDAAFVYRHTAALNGQDPAQSVVYCFPNPKAPFFAARDDGARIDLEKIQKKIDQKRADHAPLILEAAGGLLVPLSDELLVVDMIPMSGCKPLLVARAGLGTINHTLMSIEILRRRNVKPWGVVFVESVQTPADPDLVAENMEAVHRFGGIIVTGVIPAVFDFSAPAPQVYHALEKMLF